MFIFPCEMCNKKGGKANLLIIIVWAKTSGHLSVIYVLKNVFFVSGLYPSLSQMPSAFENIPGHQHPELDPHEIQPSEKH